MERFAGDMAVTVLLSYLSYSGNIGDRLHCQLPAAWNWDVYSWKTAWNELSMAAFIPYARTYFQENYAALCTL